MSVGSSWLRTVGGFVLRVGHMAAELIDDAALWWLDRRFSDGSKPDVVIFPAQDGEIERLLDEYPEG